MSARYAVYYVPEPGSTLEVLGCGLLGRNAGGADIPRLWVKLPAPFPKGLSLEAITVAPRHYGLHATLKAPFELAAGCTVGQLREALRVLAVQQQALLLPPLEVDTVTTASGQGTFLALRPLAPCTALNALAERCVRELDHWRAPLTAEDIARRGDLSARQREYMHRWGYPHVLDDFHFHITLTDPIDDPVLRHAIASALRGVFAEVCAPQRVRMRGLALMRQSNRNAPFTLAGTFPFNTLD